jgi:subtilisin family serine protease
VGIHTTDLYGFYTNATGTSLAAPHVAGALALLLSEFPNMTADRQEAALESGAVDLGASGPDNTYGFGRIDVLAAYNWLLNTPDFTVSIAPAGLTAAAGTAVSYDVTVAGLGGFTGDVALALDGSITSHATWTFSPAVAAGGSGTARLDLTTAPDTPPGSYQLVVSGTSGSTSHTPRRRSSSPRPISPSRPRRRR